jgi:hypothetical protein
MPGVAKPSTVFTIVQGQDDNRQPIFSVLAKRTYDLHSNGRVEPTERASFVRADEYYDDGDPEWATVKHETDLAPFKLATDVVVIGSAYAPNNKPVPSIDVAVEVSTQRKVLRVTGDRRCRYRPGSSPAFSDPILFTKMPIHYERAYGGRDTRSNPEEPFFYPRNHSGLGVVLKNRKETVEGLRLPNIEDPQDLLTPDRILIEKPDRWSGQPLPDGLGWFHRNWYPRCSFTGAFPAYVDVDTVLREETLDLVPKRQIGLARQFKLPSFDVRFNNGASRGLTFPYLKGNETFRLTNLTPTGSLVFKLPGETPGMTLDIGSGENELQPVLHTVCIRLEEMQVDMIWRGAHPYQGWDWLPEMKRLAAEVVWKA